VICLEVFLTFLTHEALKHERVPGAKWQWARQTLATMNVLSIGWFETHRV
jgi:hypothetical protein